MDTSTIPPPRPLDDEIVGVPEIADIASVTPAAVNTWRFRPQKNRPLFLDEDDTVGSFPVWRLERVIAWLELTGRPHDAGKWRQKKAEGGYRRPSHTGKMNERWADRPDTDKA